LEANELKNPKLLINRVRQDMVKRGDLAIDLIGVQGRASGYYKKNNGRGCSFA